MGGEKKKDAGGTVFVQQPARAFWWSETGGKRGGKEGKKRCVNEGSFDKERDWGEEG